MHAAAEQPSGRRQSLQRRSNGEHQAADRLIRVSAAGYQVNGDCKYMPALYVMNKIDQLTIEELDIIDQMPHHVPISSFHKWNIDMLMEEVRKGVETGSRGRVTGERECGNKTCDWYTCVCTL